MSSSADSMSRLRQDTLFALRTLRRRPTFAAIAIATIALGIGAATAIYSVVDGVMFRPLPFREPGRLVAVWQTYPFWRKDPILGRSWDRISFSIPEFRDWRASQTSFSHVGIWAGRSGMSLGGTGTPEIVGVIRASSTLLDVLGTTPALGRMFTDGEDVVGGPPVLMVTWEAWQNRFQADPGIVGRVFRLDERPYTVVGVLPRGLSLSRTSSPAGDAIFWSPVGQEASDANNRGNHGYQGLGRLAPGVTVAHATEEADRILRGTESPDRRGVFLREWQVDQTRDVRKPLFVLLGAVGLLLLIACVNVAVLLLGEASAREQEIAARIALGAGRGRIIGQLLTESVSLASVGAVAGTALAWAGTRLLVALAPPRIPGLASVGIDLRVLGFTLAAAAGTGILFGLAPALTLARSSPSEVFRGASGQSGRGRGRLQRALVAAELALSLVLLVGASLLSRSLDRLTAVDPGFRADHLLAARITLPRTRYADSTVIREVYRRAAERLAALPGITAVTGISNVPFGGGNSSTSIEIEGRPVGPNERLHEMEQRTILPNYFEVLGIPLVAGRFFDANDRTGAPPVVIVSQMAARREFPDESPIGKRVRFQGTWREIVGVVADTKYRQLSMDDQATIYAPLEQRAWGEHRVARAHDHRAVGLHAGNPRRARRRGAGRAVLERRPDDGPHRSLVRGRALPDHAHHAVRARGRGAGRGGDVRRDVARGQWPHARDGDSRGTRRVVQERDRAHGPLHVGWRGDRGRSGSGGRVRGVARTRAVPVRRRCHGPGVVCGERARPRGHQHRGELAPRPAGRARAAGVGAARRVVEWRCATRPRATPPAG
jgi:predicted permease